MATTLSASFTSSKACPRPASTNSSKTIGSLTCSIGTTKITSHIPGYSGFLPRADVNDQALTQGQGEQTRETFIKQNIVENHAVRVPGYGGHKPMSVVNDRGTLRPNCLSTSGETYA